MKEENNEISVIILMGVTGVGKTTIGQKLADQLGWVFYDGDDFHPQSNVDKMSAGEPLTDEDRQPWLDALHKVIHDHLQQGTQAVLTCSALKESYRDQLLQDNPGARLVYLKTSPNVVRKRLMERIDHFMKPELIDSQFDTLEEPTSVLEVDASADPEVIIEKIQEELNL